MADLRLTLDLQLFAQEKTEAATPKKRQDARKKGQVAKSMELTGSVILLFSFLFFMIFGYLMKDQIIQLFKLSFTDYLTTDLTKQNAVALLSDMIILGLKMLAPFLAGIVLLAVFGNYLQIGLLFTGEPLLMKLSKINPLEGAKRIFSLRSAVEFLKTLAKLLIIGVIVFLTIWGERHKMLSITLQPLDRIFAYAAHLSLFLGIKIGAALLIIAILDYIYQKYEFEKSLRMSKQDIKDEHKQTEGNPIIKRKIRERQMKMAMQRMMQEVPNADVVITNPTHFAVALKYEDSTMEAPEVTAKGQDYMALRIKEIARENGVVMMENKPLARALFQQTDIGDVVPAELFQAVAEVLAYVYKLKGQAR